VNSLLITNGQLVTLDPANRFFQNGKVYIEGDRIIDVGDFPVNRYAPDKVIDAAGNVVMPGLINTHHHLYSTFARGFTPAGPPALNFSEILSKLWWKLDLALNSEDVYYSALLALLDSVRAGCTTIIDHHSSPACRDGSLDQIEQAFRDVGLSGCLSYEVSDRNQPGEGIRENERYISKCSDRDDGQMSALFGLHASMTLGSETLQRCAEVARGLNAGFHVHAAEAEIDVELTIDRYGQGIMDRFDAFGITGSKSIFVHGVHFGPRDIDILTSTDSLLAVNPESNMNNGLATAPVLDFLNKGVLVGLGTDGMSAHLISQARALYLQQRGAHKDPSIAFAEACQILLNHNRTLCNRLFHEPRGALAAGQLADIIIPNYQPFTPFNDDTLYGHLLFGLSFASVRTTIARGRVIMEDGLISHLDEEAIRAGCVERAAEIWKRVNS
jgi:putative selenium metabolism protein SsnA